MVGWRTLKHPDRTAYTFLGDGEHVTGTLTFREVELRARAIAALLQKHARRGDRALLVYAPDLDFVCGFLGCLYAGLIAVPIYPPDPVRLHKTLPRFRAIVADARCEVALTTTAIAAAARAMAPGAPEIEAIRWLPTDSLDPALGETWEDPWIGDDDVAMLQYTSGSTALPRGVVVTNRNLLHNQRLIRSVAGHNEDTVVVGWLPPYHDMGLIGMLLQPLYAGGTCVFMPPFAFLKRPISWLKAIATYRGSSSPAPNFAYDLCVRKVSPEDAQALDLSSWKVAFNGAEPIRAETLQRFVERFAPSGFRPAALCPCYGLAEATLIVSGVPRGIEPTYLAVDTAELAAGRAVAAPPDATSSQLLVSSGRPLGDTRVAIVDPESGTALPEGAIGEIWLKGISVASGYFERPDESEATFEARLPDGKGPFLRTGDLGFLHDGELFVTGRLKDLIVIRGRNHYPQDLELTAERSSPAIRPGCVAAFSVEEGGAERLVLVAEATAAASPDEVWRELRRAVTRAHDLELHDLVLLDKGALPKTTSGKIQRRACRAAYADGAWRAQKAVSHG